MGYPEKVRVNTDGACRGNPGAGSIGIIIKDETGEVLDRISFRLRGTTTNNVAEFAALKEALRICHEQGAQQLVVQCDSELLIKQVKGIYSVKAPHLKQTVTEIRQLIKQFASVNLSHVLRAANKEADQLANLALDEGAPYLE